MTHTVTHESYHTYKTAKGGVSIKQVLRYKAA